MCLCTKAMLFSQAHESHPASHYNAPPRDQFCGGRKRDFRDFSQVPELLMFPYKQ